MAIDNQITNMLSSTKVIQLPILLAKLEMGFLKIISQMDAFSNEINLLFLLIIIPLFFFILKQFKTSSSITLPPGPYPWPILGNILQIGKDHPHLSFTRFAETYGPLISLKLGNQLLIVGSSHAAAIEILKTQDRSLSGRYVPHVAPAKSPLLNNLSLGWTMECNEYWRNLRTICRGELFSSKSITSQACIRQKKVSEMLEFVGKMQGQVVKIRDLVSALVFNMLSNVLVSRDLIDLEDGSVNGEVNKLLRNMMEVASSPNISDIYPILAPFDLQGLRKKSMALFHRSNKLWEPIIKERKEMRKIGTNASTQDFLDALIDNGCPDVQINMLLLELLSAGTDTSSSTIEWTLAELIKNPRCMNIVKEELVREISSQEDDDGLVKESNLPNLTYLQACIKEVLRLHPPAPVLLPHRAVESCQVMKYTIPKDSMVLVNFWAISRDPKNWEEPLVFKPERFISSSSLDYKGNDLQYIPFGAGRRICPGLPMAAKHVPMVVASLLNSFHWSLPHGMDPKDLDMSERYDLTMMKEVPLLLIPTAN